MPNIDGITIPDAISLEDAVQVIDDFYVDGGWSRRVPPGRSPVSGFGRGFRRGQLVRKTDEMVRRFPQHFQIPARPLRPEDLDES
jgi:hypothetical protein